MKTVTSFFSSVLGAIARIDWRSRTTLGISALVVVLIGAGGYAIASRGAPAATGTIAQTPRVTLARVGDLSSGGTSFSVVGSVQSETEASVLTQGAGEVTHVYRQLGDSVAAGTVIAEMENASQRAAVTQAQGALDAANASLQKVQGGTRSEQLSILQSAATAANTAAVSSLLSAYAGVDDAVHHTADLMFSNPDSASPTLNLTVSDSQVAINAQSERVSMTAIMSRESAESGNISAESDISSEIARTTVEVRAARDFFDTLIAALGKAVPSPSVTAADITADKTAASASRTALTGILTALSTAQNNLTAAKQNLSQGVTGAQPEDIASAQASVTSAEGGLAAARAALEKTIIRAPISGTINAIDLSQGDYVSAYANVVTIANNHALEIVAHVTESDAKRISVGQSVAIEGGASGTVTRIAPAIDPSTKSIEVKIGVIGTALSTLTNGQSVTVSFAAAEHAATPAPGAPLTIPIVAAKITPNGPVIFTVSASSTLEAHAVTFGPILGDRVTIASGATADMQIVTDARGLFDGETILLGDNAGAN